VIRNVVLVKLKPDADRDAVARVQDGLRGLNRPGTLSYTLGNDLELRDGNWSFAIVADFSDADTYTAYDRDEEHNRLRAELAPHAEQLARVQFELPA
jgi:quinol monooxygenase YgiN